MVSGFIDSFRAPRTLGGWALEDLREDKIEIQVCRGETIVGKGFTGKKRVAPAADCGFTITLEEPITLADLSDGSLRAYAIDVAGNPRELDVWEDLFPKSVRGNFDETSAPLEFIPGGSALYAPLCRATDLTWSIRFRGPRHYVSDLNRQQVLNLLQRDPFPIPRPANRELYFPKDHAAYWLFGLDDYRRVMNCLARYDLQPKRILDFGGSTGRVYRHYQVYGGFDEVHACDSNPTNIAWSTKYLWPDIHAIVNTFEPRLPYAAWYFDVVSAFSVFTHIDETEEAWLMELDRVLRPGGIAYLTIHDEVSWRIRSEHLLKVLRQSEGIEGIDFDAPMQAERVVFKKGRSINMFQRSDYIRRTWGRVFDIEEIIPRAHNFQATVIARKKRPLRRTT